MAFECVKLASFPIEAIYHHFKPVVKLLEITMCMFKTSWYHSQPFKNHFKTIQVECILSNWSKCNFTLGIQLCVPTQPLSPCNKEPCSPALVVAWVNPKNWSQGFITTDQRLPLCNGATNYGGRTEWHQGTWSSEESMKHSNELDLSSHSVSGSGMLLSTFMPSHHHCFHRQVYGGGLH